MIRLAIHTRGCAVASSYREPTLVLSLALAFVLSMSGAHSPQAKERIACKTPVNAGTCYWTHGRLAAYNGTPTMRALEGRNETNFSGP